MKYVPNILTIFRLILVPVFAIVFFSEIENAKYIAILIFLAASFTDFLDGYIARKYNAVSKVGIVLDPLADKLMLLTALCSLTVNSAVPLFLFALFFAKEIFMIVAGTFLWNKKENVVIPSSLPGKLATALSMVVVIMIIIFPGNKILIALLVIVFILKLFALYTYIKVYKK